MVFRTATVVALLVAAANASVVVRQTAPGEKCAGAEGQAFIEYVGCTAGYTCSGAAADWGKICVETGSPEDLSATSDEGGSPTNGDGVVATTQAPAATEAEGAATAATEGGDGAAADGEGEGTTTDAPSAGEGEGASTEAPSAGEGEGASTEAPSVGEGEGASTEAPSTGDGDASSDGADAGGVIAPGVVPGSTTSDDADDTATATTAPDDEDAAATATIEPVPSVTPEVEATPITRADITPEPTDDDDGSVCFPADATVELQDGSVVPMSQVSIGDMVKVGVNEFSKVFMFTHKMADVTHKFVTLQTATGASLALTKGHYIYADGALVAAGEVKVGSSVSLGSGALDTVVAIGSKVGSGLYNPQTVNGNVVVNGIVSSTYTTSVEPSFAHAILAPFRFMNTIGLYLTALESGSQRLADVAPTGAALVF